MPPRIVDPKNRKPEELTWRGQTFLSESDLAAEAGVSKFAVHYHKVKYDGDMSRLGKRAEGIPTEVRVAANPRSKSVTIGEHSFASERRLATACGLPVSRVQRWLRTGKQDELLALLESRK